MVRVVPDLPTFAVDDGFAYAVPDGVDAPVGALVRVPLGRQRLRGFVVGSGAGEVEGLRPLLSVSGDLAVFDTDLLGVLRWAAVHYVAPLATLLAKTAPPNLPRRPPESRFPEVPDYTPGLPAVAAAAAAGGHTRARYWLGPGPWTDAISGLASPVLAAGRSVMVVAPSLTEVVTLAGELGHRFGGRVVAASSGMGNAAVSDAWSRSAAGGGHLLVGTREVAFWPVASLALVVIVDEGRRGMKDRATPTVHARDLLWRRAVAERFCVVCCSAVPSGEALGRGPVVERLRPGRVWGLVEVVDRRDDPPGTGLLSERSRRALHATVGGGGRALIFTDRRMPSTRCVGCRKLRLCPECGSRPDRGPACPRCGAVLGGCVSCGGGRFEPLGADVGRLVAEAGGFLGRDAVGEAGSGRRVVVGTERDLAGLGGVDLVVVVDADGPLLAPNYRAGEDGLNLLARAVLAAGTGRGRRAVLQTSDPGHPVVVALRTGDPMGALRADLEARSALGFPPGGELLVLEAVDAPDGADGALRQAVRDRAEVHGPAQHRDRQRWLIQGRDLGAARIVLRSLVHEWRERRARVRIDADPVDL